jgi:hypothetical protein
MKTAASVLESITTADSQELGAVANGKATGLLKLMIKWAKAEKDHEAKTLLIGLIKKIKLDVWDKLSQKSKDELNKL